MTTILYIEDSPVAQRVVERILKLQYNVIIASNGIEAVQKGKGQKPDLVLTDLNIPGLDGYEVATSLKAVWPETPIVALTGDKSEEAHRRALIAGCDGWLTKPISPQELLKAVDRYLAGYIETLPDTAELAQEKLAYQHRLVTRLETQIMALTEANSQLTAVQKITQAITESLNLDEIIESALDNLLTVINIDYLAIFLYNANKATLKLGGNRNFPLDYLNLIIRSYNLRQKSETIAQAIRSGTPQIITDFATYAAAQSSSLTDYSTTIASLITIPLLVRDKTVGLLQVGTKQNREFTEDQSSAMDLISRQLAIAIDKAQIHTNLQTAYSDLQDLDELKNQFIMIASHELRTPLTILMGYIFLLQGESSPENQDIVETVVEQAQALNKIIDRILDVERLQHSDYLAEFVETDLNEAVGKIVKNLARLATAKNLTLIVIPSTDSSLAWLDLLKFEAILTNLLTNAIEFTPANGKIEVHIEMSPPMFEVSVKDNGIGIKASDQKRIFDKFYQVQNPIDRNHGGVGLGLTIAQDMASLCGGSISVNSSLNKGSTFTYRQPIKGVNTEGSNLKTTA